MLPCRTVESRINHHHKLMGKSGRVYALDQNKSVFDKLMDETAMMGLNNIVAVKSIKELKLYLNANSLDVVLLYDVLHSDYFIAAARNNLLKSLSTMMNAHSLLSIYPKHMGSIEIKVIRDRLKKLRVHLEREAEVHLKSFSYLPFLLWCTSHFVI